MYPNKEYNVIFKNIHQITMAYPRTKKICIDQTFWKHYWILGKIWAKQDVNEQVRSVQNLI